MYLVKDTIPSTFHDKLLQIVRFLKLSQLYKEKSLANKQSLWYHSGAKSQIPWGKGPTGQLFTVRVLATFYERAKMVNIEGVLLEEITSHEHDAIH